MKADIFQHELTGVTKTLGRRHNISIVFEGDGAATNGSIIKMPALPQDAKLDNLQVRAMRGFADHEAAHIRHTDMEVWNRMYGQKHAPDPLLQSLANALEDVRIEKLAIEEHAGVQKNLAGAAELVVKQSLEALDKRPELGSNREKALPMAIAMEGRRRMGTAVSECAEMLSRLDPDITNMASRWVDALATAKNTEDVVRLAQMIMGEMRQEKQKQDQPDGKGGGQSQGQGQGEGQSAEGGGAGKQRGENPGKGGEGAAGGGVGAGIGSNQDHDEGFSPELAQAIAKEAEKITQEAKQEHGANCVYRVFSNAHDKWHTRYDKDGLHGSYTFGKRMRRPAATARYHQAVQSAKGSVSVMRRKLERMVLSTQRRDWHTGMEQGFIDPRRLVQAVMGVPTVYRVRAERKEMDTAVAILVDMSGSMGGSSRKIDLAQQITIAMAQCLETIGAAYAVYGHNYRSPALKRTPDGKGGFEVSVDEGYYRAYADSMQAGVAWGRYEPLDMYEFKAFEDRLAECHGSLGSMTMLTGGANADADAIQYAWAKLRERREKRRILVVLSDGQPAWNCDVRAPSGENPCNYYTRQTIKSLMAQGCELVGIGICDSSVADLYPKYAVAHSISEFASKTMDSLAQVLLGERVRVSGRL